MRHRAITALGEGGRNDWATISTAATTCDLTALLDLIEQGGQLTDDTVLDLIDENLRLREQIAQHEAALEAIGAGGVSGERIRQRRWT